MVTNLCHYDAVVTFTKFSSEFQNTKHCCPILQFYAHHTMYSHGIRIGCLEVYKCATLENRPCATTETCIEHYAPTKTPCSIRCTQSFGEIQDLCYLIYGANPTQCFIAIYNDLFIIFNAFVVLPLASFFSRWQRNWNVMRF